MGELVVGMGEVGQALTQVLGCPGRDIEPSGLVAGTLHIAYPWSESFVEDTLGYVYEHEADLVIVHSTVPVGTCDQYGWVHSPVRGRHPNLFEALTTFVKFAGGRRAGEMRWPGKLETTALAATTEAAKLWELAAFGLQVRLCQAVYEYSDAHGLNADVVYRQFAETHNEGVVAMGYPEVVKPVLDYVPGPIGGHCVTENMGLLDHPVAGLVAEGFTAASRSGE
jgi:hypothetical protein